MAQFIRPTMRTHRGCYSEPKSLTQEEIHRVMRTSPARHVPERQWCPPTEYEDVAKHMPAGAREAYIARCVEWFANRPARPIRHPVRHENVDVEAMAALIAKYGSAVPLGEFSRVGYSDEAVEKVRVHREWMKDHAAELDAEIERRWPGSTKTKPKAVKVIKAVKKKMN